MNSINFKFKKNWEQFLAWHDAKVKKAKVSPPLFAQKDVIQSLFESTVPNIINWDSLWKNFDKWFKTTYIANGKALWSEQQRQIETYLLTQTKELNSENFILIFKLNGKLTVDSQVMTYWDALRTKQNLEGDSNGVGGNEDIECVSVVNLNNLI
jgi:hypothetical protein